MMVDKPSHKYLLVWPPDFFSHATSRSKCVHIYTFWHVRSRFPGEILQCFCWSFDSTSMFWLKFVVSKEISYHYSINYLRPQRILTTCLVFPSFFMWHHQICFHFPSSLAQNKIPAKLKTSFSCLQCFVFFSRFFFFFFSVVSFQIQTLPPALQLPLLHPLTHTFPISLISLTVPKQANLCQNISFASSYITFAAFGSACRPIVGRSDLWFSAWLYLVLNLHTGHHLRFQHWFLVENLVDIWFKYIRPRTKSLTLFSIS